MKLGIVGSGKIVHDFLTTANKIDNLELAAISTTKRSEGIAQDLAKKYDIKEAYADNDRLYHDSTVDTVYVGVPNFLHYDVAKKALEAGKNVICEKPLVETIDQAKELKKIADENDRIIVEAITNIHLENYKQIKKDLSEIAPIHIVSLNFTQYSSRYDNFLKGIIEPVFDPKKDGGAFSWFIWKAGESAVLPSNAKGYRYFGHFKYDLSRDAGIPGCSKRFLC